MRCGKILAIVGDEAHAACCRIAVARRSVKLAFLGSIQDAQARALVVVVPDGAVKPDELRLVVGEFCLILKNCTSQSAAERIQAFTEERRTFWYEGVEHPFTLSVGYAELSAADAGRTPALLLSKADLALYEVKLRGKRGCLAYSEDLQLRVRTHLGFALQDISQHLPGAFLIYKADRVNDELLFANQEMVRFAGCTDLEDLLAFTDHSFRNLIHPDEREAVEQSIWAQQDAQQDGTNDYVSFRLVKKDGTYRPVLDHGRLIHNQHYGDIFYVLFMDSDFIRERYQNNT